MELEFDNNNLSRTIKYRANSEIKLQTIDFKEGEELSRAVCLNFLNNKKKEVFKSLFFVNEVSSPDKKYFTLKDYNIKFNDSDIEICMVQLKSDKEFKFILNYEIN